MVNRWIFLLKVGNMERKINHLEENGNFRNTVITYVRSAIKCLRLLLVYIAHHCYPRNGVQVYKSEWNIFVSIQYKIVPTWWVKSRWNATVSFMKNSARSSKILYMLYIFGFALWRIWMHHGRRFMHYDSPDGRTLRARKTFTVLWCPLRWHMLYRL